MKCTPPRGGTLWQDRLSGQLFDEHCLARLAALLPDVDPAVCLAALRAALGADDTSPVQDTHAVLAGALQALGVVCESVQSILREWAPVRPG